MILQPELCLAMRCPACQDTIIYRDFSLFSLRGGDERWLRCSCGEDVFSLRLAGKHLYIESLCPFCGERHNYIHNLSELAGDQAIILSCRNSGLDLAFIGGREAVCRAMRHEQQDLAAHADDLKDYLVDPKVTLKALILVNELFGRNGVHCASCGGDSGEAGGFDVEMQKRRLIIHCAKCETRMQLFCTRPSDLLLISRARGLRLQKGRSAILFPAYGEK